MSRKYGKVDIETRHAAIRLIPRYDVVAASSVDRRKTRVEGPPKIGANVAKGWLAPGPSRVQSPAPSSTPPEAVQVAGMHALDD